MKDKVLPINSETAECSSSTPSTSCESQISKKPLRTDSFTKCTKKRKRQSECEYSEKILKTEDGVVKMQGAKCKECGRKEDDPNLHIFEGYSNAIEECVMLTDEKLDLYESDQNGLVFSDELDLPTHKITQFCIYDSCMHLVALDSGLIEKDIFVYASGYVKRIDDEDPSIEGGIATSPLGPISEWWLSGYDGGENVIIGFSTVCAHYYIMQPSEEYKPYMDAMKEKFYISKHVIELLLQEPGSDYEELVNYIQNLAPPNGVNAFSEETLITNADFIVNQVVNFDDAGTEEDELLRVSPSIRSLIQLAGAKFGKKSKRNGPLVKKPITNTLATTTPLVQHVFETYFAEQISKESSINVTKIDKRQKRCGVCEICQQSDCGECKNCQNMIKFGGTGKFKQACSKRRCPNMAINEANQDEVSDDERYDLVPTITSLKHKISKKVKNDAKWIGQPLEKVQCDKGWKYFSACSVNKENIYCGDYILVQPQDPKTPVYVAKVAYFYEDCKGKKMFHALWLSRAAETVLGETGDPQEVFLLFDCQDVEVKSISKKAQVDIILPSNDWFNEGGEEVKASTVNDDETSFYLKKSTSTSSARLPNIQCCTGWLI